MSTHLPLPLRNALAELAIAGLEASDAAAALAWLTRPDGPPAPPAASRLAAVHLIDPDGTALLGVHAPYAPEVAAHAARALAARDSFPAPAERAADPLARASRQAAALWNQGLFFEVHEVLEAVWRTVGGDLRQALQGVIQIAVAFHHLAHGNLRGARSLLVEGRQRLATSPAMVLPMLDVPALLTATASSEEALRAGRRPPTPPPPLVVR